MKRKTIRFKKILNSLRLLRLVYLDQLKLVGTKIGTICGFIFFALMMMVNNCNLLLIASVSKTSSHTNSSDFYLGSYMTVHETIESASKLQQLQHQDVVVFQTYLESNFGTQNYTPFFGKQSSTFPRI